MIAINITTKVNINQVKRKRNAEKECCLFVLTTPEKPTHEPTNARSRAPVSGCRAGLRRQRDVVEGQIEKDRFHRNRLELRWNRHQRGGGILKFRPHYLLGKDVTQCVYERLV